MMVIEVGTEDFSSDVFIFIDLGLRYEVVDVFTTCIALFACKGPKINFRLVCGFSSLRALSRSD